MQWECAARDASGKWEVLKVLEKAVTMPFKFSIDNEDCEGDAKCTVVEKAAAAVKQVANKVPQALLNTVGHLVDAPGTLSLSLSSLSLSPLSLSLSLCLPSTNSSLTSKGLSALQSVVSVAAGMVLKLILKNPFEGQPVGVLASANLAPKPVMLSVVSFNAWQILSGRQEIELVTPDSPLKKEKNPGDYRQGGSASPYQATWQLGSNGQPFEWSKLGFSMTTDYNDVGTGKHFGGGGHVITLDLQGLSGKLVIGHHWASSFGNSSFRPFRRPDQGATQVTR